MLLIKKVDAFSYEIYYKNVLVGFFYDNTYDVSYYLEKGSEIKNTDNLPLLINEIKLNIKKKMEVQNVS